MLKPITHPAAPPETGQIMKAFPTTSSFLLTLAAGLSAGPIGIFEQAADIGKIELKGTSEYLAEIGQYRITGSGRNLWFGEDACQFLSKKITGDLVFTMEAGWETEGREPHRKACAMVRQSLDEDSPYVDIAVHGDGLIELQYRMEKGAPTLAAMTPVQTPATVKLERDGDVFTASVSTAGGPFQPIGAVALAMPNPVHAGLAVCAHNSANLETAIFSNVTLTHRVPAENENRVRETSIEILDIETGGRTLIHRDLTLTEAPNWSRDGKTLYVNREGGIWTLPASGGEPTRIDTGVADKNNNDHGLSTDGRWLALSSGSGENGSKIYIVPSSGGEARLITPIGPSYWHGWSPDDKILIYCAKRNDNFDIFSIPVEGGPETRLTEAEGLDDGCEYTPDGGRIYFHSERAGGVPRIFRMNADGSDQEQATFDEQYADWFPHPSPDGKWIAFVSFGAGVKGHPYDKNVVIRLMPLEGGKPKVIATLFGGQGTINVPSWSPDGKKFAFVSYRHILKPSTSESINP
jgi:TolB protein